MRIKLAAFALAFLPASWALALTSATTSFQKDVNGFTNVTQIRISTTDARDGSDGVTLTNYLIDGWQIDDPETEPIEADSPDEQDLIKFGGLFGGGAGQIPLGATILDAKLTYKTFGTGTTPPSPGPWGVAGLSQAFTTATRYDDFPSANAPPTQTSRGAWFEDAYATRPVGGFAGLAASAPGGPTGTQVLNGVADADVWPLIQRWSDGQTNHGFVVQAGWTGQTNGWGFYTSGDATVANRPKLSVTYTTDAIGIKTFQRGDANSYAGDSIARLDSGGDLNGSSDDVTLDGTTLDGSYYIDGATSAGGIFSGLFKFDNVFGAGASQAPTDKPVAKAWLVLTGGMNDDNRSPGPFSVHPMLRDWDADSSNATKPSLYSEFGAIPGFTEADGDIGAVLDSNFGGTNGGESWFDVTTYMEAVRTGAQNLGFALLPNTGDGWGIQMGASTDVSVRPRIVIYSDLTTTPVGVPGDFNDDDKVDAADYVTWRKNETANAALPNDNGLATQSARYSLWRSSFGNPGSGGGLGAGAVPEPASMLLVAIAVLGFGGLYRRR